MIKKLPLFIYALKTVIKQLTLDHIIVLVANVKTSHMKINPLQITNMIKITIVEASSHCY